MIRTIVILAVAVLSGAVGLASYAQRAASHTAHEEMRTAERMRTAMVDQETGLRGLMLAGEEDFLAPFRSGDRAYADAVRDARGHVDGDARAQRALREADAAARAWRVMAENAIAGMRSGARERILSDGLIRERKDRMDRFRRLNGRYASLMASRAGRLEDRAMLLSVLVVAILGAVFALIGGLLGRRRTAALRRRLAAERAFADAQADLNVGLQVTESEEEAQTFLRRHLERSIPGSEVVVLKRNNSANRLLPGTPLHEGSKLEGAFAETEPRSCLAIRLAQRRTHTTDGPTSVLECDICGKLETQTTCSPLLVGGEVIGSVLVGHPEPLEDRGACVIDESVKQAAPVLANLRNLAIAETRASTDGLTGLPNRRAFEESLKRMVAHANRAMSPLAAVALDLDHFKQINDANGHALGDEVLATIGAMLKSLLRNADLASRVGGEEFMLLLPDTSRDGALVICERLRGAIESLEFTGLDGRVTASLGVAVLPDDATDGTTLVRAADRMLYAAKANGRNRVEITELAMGPLPDGEAAVR